MEETKYIPGDLVMYQGKVTTVNAVSKKLNQNG